jgi:hypothetical protein
MEGCSFKVGCVAVLGNIREFGGKSLEIAHTNKDCAVRQYMELIKERFLECFLQFHFLACSSDKEWVFSFTAIFRVKYALNVHKNSTVSYD